MAKNWLGSEVGMVLKTVTVPKTSTSYVTENGRKIVKSGTLINDSTLGYGLLFNDADITDEDRVASMMIRGTYINDNLPTKLTNETTNPVIDNLAKQGLYNITYPTTNVTYGEVE